MKSIGRIGVMLLCAGMLAACSAPAAEENTVVEETEVIDEPQDTDESVETGDNGEGTPFAEHGILSVKGTQLVDENGKPVQLYGMSTHGLAWFGEYVNHETFTWLYDDWKTNCIRLAMYTDEYGGYCSGGDTGQLKNLIKEGVEAAAEQGMYVIIDWHILSDQDPLRYKDQALAFFDEMSQLYGENGNVLYEICNEPNGSGTWQNIKSYASEVIPVIRMNDPDSIILVGTPTWSQDIDQALADPLEYDNIMYTLHFYAATHTDWLRDRLSQCIGKGLPVFISEFGICDASGNGNVDIAQADAWKQLIDQYNLSSMCWNLSNKNESSAVIKPDCSKLSGWTEDELSEEGIWFRNWCRSKSQ